MKLNWHLNLNTIVLTTLILVFSCILYYNFTQNSIVEGNQSELTTKLRELNQKQSKLNQNSDKINQNTDELSQNMRKLNQNETKLNQNKQELNTNNTKFNLINSVVNKYPVVWDAYKTQRDNLNDLRKQYDILTKMVNSNNSSDIVRLFPNTNAIKYNISESEMKLASKKKEIDKVDDIYS